MQRLFTINSLALRQLLELGIMYIALMGFMGMTAVVRQMASQDVCMTWARSHECYRDLILLFSKTSEPVTNSVGRYRVFILKILYASL